MVPETLYNLSMYVDGRGFLQRTPEVSPPKLKLKTEDYRAGGMDVAVKIDQGMEALQASFTMSTIERDVLKYFGVSDGSAFNATFRGAFRDTKGKTKAVALIMRGMLSEYDPGSWKPGEKSEIKYTAELSYYKAEIDGAVIHEIDAFNMIRVIDGVDQLAEVRKALGM
ncbi:phage tail protein [Burkholderia stagnalis]|uniref:phage major tail tube protein n=1 Tax=Burkholderia stagnalis TaxID=1503054 RepID=UPI000756E877|nr:phage major tail tube protein [Burkholderia stagnalis]RQR48914.1 phage major tail tube protein [Burkholderia sp. Bp9126]KVL94319.1 phage tail protein [Burkholderia stagnalis]KVL98852.1 phage tail protein [Burkholderia stagnalis]KVM07904.1 phage tail protein [Burkholderia stagnalis]KVN38315.1 phage tail protein [Burkholderia stagnalis]